MSIRSVRAGSTNPYEIRKLLKKGVEVYSRGSLHAKYILADDTLIAGSSNISKHARHSLDEAAVRTNDAAAVARARATFIQLCNEPVRKDCLAKCIKEYRPPRFQNDMRSTRTTSRSRAGKLWIVGGLQYFDLPQSEETAATRALADMQTRRHHYERSIVDYNTYSRMQKYFDKLREGDWLITCVRDGSGFDVQPPSRFLGIRSYARESRKRRYLVLYEHPEDGKNIRWSELRKTCLGKVAAIQRPKPRTMPVSDEEADFLLRLWTPLGTFKRSRR